MREGVTGESVTPSVWLSMVPPVVLVGIIALTISIYGTDALSGGCQLALLFGTSICASISMAVYGVKWSQFENAIRETISSSASSIIILLIIGMMSAAWMISGVVPTLIYYGIEMMSPRFFLVTTCILCAVISVMTGSSWTTIATIGVALTGIGEALGISTAWTAGAIISGSYFGDKISPLSDTTTLAASTTGTDLFGHIRYMMYTTVPTMCISCVIYLVAGLWIGGKGELHVSEYGESIKGAFNITPWVLVVPLITGIMIYKKVPSLITLFASSMTGIGAAMILQTDVVTTIGDGGLVKGAMTTLFTSTSVETGNTALNELVSTSGMSGMLNTIWLILCAMCFGGAMVASGMLHSITMGIIRGIRGTLGLVSANVASCLVMNLTTCDQYISIILSGNMFSSVYKEMGYKSHLLSRTTEDSVTVTSVLIPWNTCGMTQSTVLGVATITYLPYCFFNYLSPLMSIIVAATGWKIEKTDTKEKA